MKCKAVALLKIQMKKVTFLLQEGGCHLFGHQKNLDVWTVLGVSVLFWSCKCLHLFFQLSEISESIPADFYNFLYVNRIYASLSGFKRNFPEA